jgi:2-polyprenyl-6-methoxyphenol hydroxylase-like FAD-dependent oxidoreductase
MSGRRDYDAVIVGARCAGSPLAARLAERGWSVLLVDREPPPADTLSTHVLFPNTLARLRELGALAKIEAGHRLNPVIYAAKVLGVEFEGAFTPVGGFDRMCGITRPVLDTALLEVAVEAGAETRFGERVIGLLGGGEGPVRGVVLEGGEEIRARWTIGADGRASTVASRLGLEKQRPLAGEMAFMFGYFRGLPNDGRFTIGVEERASLSASPCEDDISILILGCEPELTHGDAEQRRHRFLEGLEQFEWLDTAAVRSAEQVAPIRVAPETMLRGYFRDGSGPGWALVGDAGHFKHPSTAQGISDAIEQSLHVADELTAGEGLDGYEAWREERAREHYEWSFDFGRFPTPVTRPLFRGIASDPAAAQDFRDSFSRLTRPRSDILTAERRERWFQPVSS